MFSSVPFAFSKVVFSIITCSNCGACGSPKCLPHAHNRIYARECNGFFNSRRAWIASLICSDTGFCTGDICGRNDGCYYGPIRKSLYEADILVANHSLLLTDAKVSGILPEHDTIIVDEVHNLVKGGYDQFKISLDYNSVSSLLDR